MKNFLFVTSITISLLAGASAESAPLADSKQSADLMQIAFPGWQASGRKSVREIVLPPVKTPSGPPTPSDVESLLLVPSLVLNLAEDRVVLIVTGIPADAEGNSRAGHSSPAVLGAYWFEKRADRWFKLAEQPAFTAEGFFGDPGMLRQIDMGDGTIGLAVENGSCWQGSCGHFVALYRVGEKQIDPVFGELISSDSEESTNSCADLMKLNVGQKKRVPIEDYSTNYGCYHIDGHWKILPASSGPGQLLVEFTGKQTHARMVPVPALAGKTRQTTKGPRKTGDQPAEEYLVTIDEVRQKQVYNFTDGRYMLVGGKNPNPGI